MKKNWPLFLFLGVAYLLYLPTVGAGFVTDFIGFLQRVETHGPGGFIHSFGFPALQPLLNGCLIALYQICGINGWVWFLIFTGLHGVNAFLLFKLAHRLSRKHLQDDGLLWPMMAGFIFLCSPFHSEAVVWKVCFNFLFSSTLMLIIFHLLLHYLESKKNKWIYLSSLLYFCALLTFELPLILPLILITYLLFFHGQQFFQVTLRMIGPLLLLVGIYFVANKFILEDWVGHYGADTHLNIDLKLMTQQAWKYTAKHLGFVRFYPHKIKTAVFDFFNKPIIFYASILLALTILFIGYLRRKKWDAHSKLIGFSVIAFYLALAPILNLYFYTLQYLENDRYGYFPSIFLALGLIFLLKKIPKFIGLTFAILYLGFSVKYLFKMNQLWASSNRVVQGLLESYQWENEQEVYLLNLPENMEGIYMFRDHRGKHQSFAPTLKYLTDKKPVGVVKEVIQYNLTHEKNGAIVGQDSLGNIHLELHDWGSWWWRKGFGGKEYETEDYQVKFEGKKYKLQTKRPLSDAVFLFHDGLKWKEYEFQE